MQGQQNFKNLFSLLWLPTAYRSFTPCRNTRRQNPQNFAILISESKALRI